MVAKIRHQCERCGLEAVLERAGRFRDDDYYEMFQEHMELDAAHRQLITEHARLLLRFSKAMFSLEHANAAIEFDRVAHEAEQRIAAGASAAEQPQEEVEWAF